MRHGLLVTIDEVNPDIDEMVTLVAAFQHFLDEGKKVALIMAGSPVRGNVAAFRQIDSFR